MTSVVMKRPRGAWIVWAGGLAIAIVGFSQRQVVQPPTQNEYVDSTTCADCHSGIADTYSNTGMARSFSLPDAASFPDPKPYFHPASSTWYQIVSRGSSWYQRSWQIGFNGEPESIGESKIDYVMGSGNHSRAYIHRTLRNTLVELPLAWYSENGGAWALNPGLDEINPAIGRKISYECMFCHNAYPSVPSGHEDLEAEPVYGTEVPHGIDCQRCHGPGGDHVRAASRGAKLSDIQSAIVNPGRLAKDRAMEVCMQCHLETTSAALPNMIRRFDRGPFSYRPGERLSAFQLYFDHAPESGREVKYEIVNSVYRLRQSKCFLESQGKLGCTSCHNPHDIQHGQKATDAYNQVCQGCHQPAAIAVKAHPSRGDCVSCHMPKRRAEDVVHVVMTDHLIQRRQPANPLAPLSERHGPEAEYRGEVVPYGDQDDLYTAVAQVANSSNLERGIPRLEAEIGKRKPERPEFYMELGDALEHAGRPDESAAAYRAALEKTNGSALLLDRLAAPLQVLGKSRESLEALQRAVTADQNQPESWYRLGLLESDLGDKKSAVESLRKSIALDPESAASHRSLGAALTETGQFREAEAEIRAALKLQPAMPEAHSSLAYLLANRGDLEAAIWHFERGGDGAVNQFNYALTLAGIHRMTDARIHLEKSLQADSRQPLAHDVLGGLLEAEGKTAEAISHFRSAIALRPDFGKAHLDLGTALVRNRDKASAATEFRAAQSDSDPQVRAAAAAGLAALGAK